MSDIVTIFGPPGTGKTTELAKLIDGAVKRFGANRVVVASLTKTAASEIIGRGIQVNREHVGTLHAICHRMLGKPELVYKTIGEFNEHYHRNVTASNPDVDDLATDAPAEKTGSDKLREEMDVLRARMVPRELWNASVRRFADEWDAWKAYTGTIDFTDMIERTLAQYERAIGDPAAIYYDEAQDGSALELALIRQWAAHTDHTRIAGDDDQALYRWRGASIEDFLAFSDDEHKRVLTRSYRLPRAVHRYAQRWVSRIKVRQAKDYEPRDEAGEVVMRDHVLTYPESVLPELEDHMQAGRSVMLLASCGYMLDKLVACLREHGMPFHNPYRLRNGKWNPLGGDGCAHDEGRWGASSRVLAYTQAARSDAPPWTWPELHAWVDVMRADVFPRGTKARVAELRDKPEMVPDYEIYSLLGHEPVAAARRADLEWFRVSLLDAKKKVHQFALAIAERHGIEVLRHHRDDVQGVPGRGITVGTIHSVKGGEADVVYMWPDLSQAGAEEYHSAARDNVLRTFYVGITRARHACYLCAPSSGRAVEWMPVG